MEIVAHRGSSYLAPENTLAAFRLGWEETTTCELDIQETADGKLLVLHDDSTKRTTGTDLKASEHSLSELQHLDAGLWKGAQWKGEKLPSLKEVLSALPMGKRLFIEIKAGAKLVLELKRSIAISGKEDQLVVQSFDYDVCVEARKTIPAIPVFFLVDFDKNLDASTWSAKLEEAIEKATAARLAGVNPNNSELLDSAGVEKIHAAGLKLYVWTVDQVDQAKRLHGLGVDGLITNRPEWLKAQLTREFPNCS